MSPPTSPPKGSNGVNDARGDHDESDEDDEIMDLKLIQSFADKIQHLPDLDNLGGPSRPKLVIPKRGEKDFEPLSETSNLQDMMLQKSREALFGTLVGVRGGHSKTISHALLSPSSPYPSLLISRGHVLDSMGTTMRSKGKSRVELLPEEALYLAERGSLQIWLGDAGDADCIWSDACWGVEGAVEMSVMECFANFIGKDGLSWTQYQAYAYLKRLGYTVQRTQAALPPPFSPVSLHDNRLQPFRSWWTRLPGWIAAASRALLTLIGRLVKPVVPKQQFLRSFSGGTYSLLFSSLRVQRRQIHLTTPKKNPYEPFFHVWKPGRAWSKSKWDRGSNGGLEVQPPDFAVAVVDSRHEKLPTLQHLAQVFESVADEPQGPTRRQGPQYAKPVATSDPKRNWMAALRTGDRALVVAVNDCGNIGWVRFGRTAFENYPVI